MNHSKKILLASVTTLLVGISTCSFATTGKITGTGVRVRKEASTESEIITNLYKNDEVEVIEKVGDWYKITFEGKEGYTHKDYIQVEEEVVNNNETIENNNQPQEQPNIQEQPTEETILEKKVSQQANVYILPVIYSTVTDTILQDKVVTINQVINNWSNISCEGINGWVRNCYLVDLEQQTTTSTVETKKAYVNVSSYANVREQATTNSSVVTTVKNNAEVVIIGEQDSWYKITVNGKEGYISKDLVSDKQTTVTNRSQELPRNTTTVQNEVVEEPQTEEVAETVLNKTGYVSVKVANVRKEANTNSKIVTTLDMKSEVKIIGEKEDFYKIEVNGTNAYIAKRLVVDSIDEVPELPVENTTVNNTNAQVQNTTSSNSSNSSVVEYAKQYLGYKYVLGGASPSAGFDCSGFTYYVFKHFGVTLNRRASQQIYNGTKVEKSNLQPGDLIIFNDWDNVEPGHCGIYIGGNQFIHAANSKRGVVIDYMDSRNSYYNARYVEARRII